MILSNSLSVTTDEGCLRLSESLVKRIKRQYPDTFIATYERESSLSDTHLQLNKFLLNKSLIDIIRKRKENLLYVPFPSKASSTVLRVFILSLFQRNKLSVIFPMRICMSGLFKLLFKISGAGIIAFSSASAEYYADMFGSDRVTYLKAGVDSKKFVPVSEEESKQLKIKYSFNPDVPVVLHVGHLNNGRGVAELMKLSKDYQVLLVVSTLTKNEQDLKLREELLRHPNIRIIDDYIQDIEEIYQLCDVYFFPVKTSGCCIDIPLSCMEAAACNKPIITTDYGEMKNFYGKDGFCFMDSFDANTLNDAVDKLLKLPVVNSRDAVLDYDWDKAIPAFADLV
ncbi:MAG: glycosyltransferase family 4 protein [Ruminococcus sp.]|nr:glycosyltransferase family 4 protein [Ruminococcus sp.]